MPSLAYSSPLPGPSILLVLRQGQFLLPLTPVWVPDAPRTTAFVRPPMPYPLLLMRSTSVPRMSVQCGYHAFRVFTSIIIIDGGVREVPPHGYAWAKVYIPFLTNIIPTVSIRLARREVRDPPHLERPAIFDRSEHDWKLRLGANLGLTMSSNTTASGPFECSIQVTTIGTSERPTSESATNKLIILF